jgi:hypothetical protein
MKIDKKMNEKVAKKLTLSKETIATMRVRTSIKAGKPPLSQIACDPTSPERTCAQG